MYLIWAFNLTNAIDPQTKNPIPVDINEYDIVRVVSYAKFTRTLTKVSRASIRYRNLSSATSK